MCEVPANTQQHGTALGLITYNALNSACEKGKQPERALELFEAIVEEMRLQHVAMNGIIFLAGVDALLMASSSAVVIT